MLDTLPLMPAASFAKPEQRLLSLDVFRGVTILFMVLVNNAGGSVSYRQLEHSRMEWLDADRLRLSVLSVDRRSRHHTVIRQKAEVRKLACADVAQNLPPNSDPIRSRTAHLRLPDDEHFAAEAARRLAAHRHLLPGRFGDLSLHRRSHADRSHSAAICLLLDDDDADSCTGLWRRAT